MSFDSFLPIAWMSYPVVAFFLSLLLQRDISRALLALTLGIPLVFANVAFMHPNTTPLRVVSWFVVLFAVAAFCFFWRRFAGYARGD